MGKTELKPLPCPFCGHEPDLWDCPKGWYIECDNKECLIQPGISRPIMRYAAILSWNRRTQ